MDRSRRTVRHTSYRHEEIYPSPDETGATGNSELGKSRVGFTSARLIEKLMPNKDIGSHYTVMKCMTNTQIAQERLRAAEQELALDQIQAEYNTLMAMRAHERETVLAQIEAKYNPRLKFLSDMLRTTTQVLFKTRANLGIRRLPLEVLGEIFIIHVRRNNQSPWVLMHVCRAWRNAALGTRAVWGAIQLISPIKAPEHRVRNVEGREICMEEGQLDRALARAASTPLDLQISFHAKRKPRYSFSSHKSRRVLKQEKQIETLLGCVADKMDKAKLRSLTLEVNGWADFPISTLDGFTFQYLETLILDDRYPKLIEKAGNQAVHLRHLTLMGSDLEKVANRPWLTRLEGLHILEEKDYLSSVNATTIYSLLRRLTSLQSLSIGGAILNTIPESGMDMPSLKSLKLRYNRNSHWPIECVNLTHLSIECQSRWSYGSIQGRIHLPHLQVFNYRAWGCFCLDVFVVPPLCEFHLDGSPCNKAYMRMGMQKIWNKTVTTPNIEPLMFRLHHARVHPKVLADAIRNMTRVEEVRIEHTEVASEFFDELHPIAEKKQRVAMRDERSVCPPTMRVLRLDMSGCKSKEGAEAYEKAAKELLTRRRNANMPMEKIEVRLTEKDEWMVFKDE